MKYKEYIAKCLAPRSCNDRVAIKIYIEQLLTKQERFDADGNVRELTEDRKQEVLKAFKARIKSIPKNEWQIIAIVHDKDPARGGWSDATDKPHIHVIVRCVERDKSGDYKRPRVTTYLNRLGIYYQISDDNPVDLKLWQEHGVEYCCHFAENAIYLLHKSDKAKADGKEPYEIEELFGNLTEDEIREVMKGYTQVGESLGKVTDKTLAELDETAYKLGYDLVDFDEWYGSLPFNVRSNAKMRTVKESYERGVNKRLENGERVARLCVFIQSPPNKGKSYAARYALQKLGKRYLDVSGQGTGKFDNLKIKHDAIIVDDDACGKHLLNLADETYTRVYKRSKDNPVWAGDYLIVTSNLSFDSWLSECGIYNNGQIKAARSRFYICKLTRPEELNRDVLYCTSRADRGGDDNLQELDKKYIAFKDFFNKSLAEYSQVKNNRERLEINAVTVTPDEPEACARAGEREERQRQAAARFAEDMRAEFEEAVAEPDEYLDKVWAAILSEGAA